MSVLGADDPMWKFNLGILLRQRFLSPQLAVIKMKNKLPKRANLVVCLSGRGDKDMPIVLSGENG